MRCTFALLLASFAVAYLMYMLVEGLASVTFYVKRTIFHYYAR